MRFDCVFFSYSVSGRRGSTASEKKRSKSRARSKSPFRSFRWPKSKSRPSQPQAGSYSDDEGDVTESTLSKSLGYMKMVLGLPIGDCFGLGINSTLANKRTRILTEF